MKKLSILIVAAFLSFGSVASARAVDVDLLMTADLNGNEAWVTASIAGSSANTSVSYWKLGLGCQSALLVSGKNGENLCGTEMTFYRANMYDPTDDYLVLTAGVVNSGTSESNLVLTLVAYDAYGNNIGGDKEGIVLEGTAAVPQKPTVSVSISPRSIQVGESAKLRWSTEHASRCILQYGPDNGNIYGPYEESIGLSGSKTVSPSKTYTYYVWCTNETGSGKDGDATGKAATLKVTTAPAAALAPSIYVSAYPATISAGQSGTLYWSTTNALRCVLHYGNKEEKVATGGATIVNPSVTTTYKIWCANDSGDGKDGPSASKTATISVSAGGGYTGTNPASPYNLPADIDRQSVASCLSLRNDLRYRSRDAETGGEVSLLQDFLQSKKYLNSEPTGFFGLMTFSAVQQFQSANGISGTGYVGPLTRAKIKAFTCL